MRITAYLAVLAAACLALASCTKPQVAHGSWALQVSASTGAALVLAEGGSEALRIACRRNPADLLVTTSRLPGAAGLVHLEIGVASFDLRAEADTPGLVAMGAPGAGLPAALASGQPIVVRREGGVIASFGAPDAGTAQAFAAACRASLS